MISSYAPGNSWVGTEGQTEASRHGIDIRYGINTAVDAVRVWMVTDNGVGVYASYSTVGTYSPGQLSKLIMEDEEGGEVVEFKDKEGKVVMKKVLLTAQRDTGSGQDHTGWLVTYYMYDDLNRLRCVLQPKGFELAAAAGMVLTNAQILSQQCFRYEYDARNRMIIKQVPGAGTVEMVYDKRDRMVMSRDSSLKSQGYWQVYQYDDLNRLIQNGLTYNSSSRAAHQTLADGSINYPATDVAGLLQVNYYGDYAWTSGVAGMSSTVTTTDFVPNFFLTPNTTPDYAQPMTPDYVNLKDKQTGYWTRVLGTSTLLYTAIFYDQDGRVLQKRETNISGGVDITSFQYDFSGKLLRKLLAHQKAGSAGRSVKELTKYSYDHAGRQTSVVKKIGLNGVDKTIASNTYDELGRLKTKGIGTSVETQTNEYNVRGWLIGMNRQWIKNGGNNWFGYELGYDNNQCILPGTYAFPEFRGNIAGLIWKSAGDNAARSYDFKYDGASRLLKADFNQFTGGYFNRQAGIDYSVVMGDGIHGDSAYDVNGNILHMIQKGFKVNSSVALDDMRYSYQTSSNKLAKVTDTVIDSNSKLGDFKDGSNGTTDDYSYTANGNLYADKNKGITSILYTHQNQPYEINITGKGKISYFYDNLGNKLKKVVVDNTVNPAVTTTWLYIQNYVYKNDTLQFFTHEEGRARPDTAFYGSSELTKFDYDYFLKDHLGNVRTVLTEKKDTAAYLPLTFEDANKANQNIIWENKNGASINVDVERTARPAGFGTSGSNGSWVMDVQKSSGPVGAAKLLKVMAKDTIEAMVEYYYTTPNADNSSANGVSTLIGSLASAILGSSQVSDFGHGLSTAISGNVNADGSFMGLLNTPNAVNGTSNAPKAYLNIVFFDDQFKPDNSASIVLPVAYLTSPQTKQALTVAGANAAIAKKNGYVYIYFSNESNDIVYFDNFNVTHKLGPLREETHYYPFGLTMAAISSKAIGKLENKNKFNKGSELQSKEFSDGSGLEWYDTHFRQLDPQLGRWWQIDPKPDLAQSPYSTMSNNPMLYNDPLGDSAINPRGQQLNTDNQGMISNSNVTPNRITNLERHPISTVNSIILHRTVAKTTKSTLSSFAAKGAGTHFLVGKDGKIYQTASLNSATSHLRESQIKKGFENVKNNTAIGIEVVGDYDQKTKTWDPVTEEQASSTAFVVNSLEKTYSLGDGSIHNHEDVQPKTAGEGGTVYKAIEPMLDSRNTTNNNNQPNYLAPPSSLFPAYFDIYQTIQNR